MVLWKEEGGWRYEYFEPDVDPAVLSEFESLLRLWQSRRRGRRVPARADFDVFDFTGWLGWIALYDVSYDPFDYRVRLSGTKIDELYGFTATGLDRNGMNQHYAEIENRDAFDEFNCRNLTISHTVGPLNVADRTFRSVSILELPLSDDGERASGTIEAVVPHRSEPE